MDELIENKNLQATWLKAFIEVIKQGKGRGKPALKSGMLIMTIVFPVIFFFGYLDIQSQNSGDIPPLAPMIKSKGYFEKEVRMYKGHETGIAIFHSNQGGVFITAPEFEFKNEIEWIESNPKKQVYVEGFLLKNGKGSFFSMYVKPDGEPALINPNEAINYLNMRKSLKMFYPLVYLCLILFGISTIIVYQMKKKISA